MIETIPLFVHTDIHIVDKDFTAANLAERLLQADLAGPDRLDLGTGQDQARLVGIVDKVVVIRFLVVGDDFYTHKYGFGIRVSGVRLNH